MKKEKLGIKQSRKSEKLAITNESNQHLFFSFIKFYCIFSESNLYLLHYIDNREDIFTYLEPRN